MQSSFLIAGYYFPFSFCCNPARYVIRCLKFAIVAEHQISFPCSVNYLPHVGRLPYFPFSFFHYDHHEKFSQLLSDSLHYLLSYLRPSKFQSSPSQTYLNFPANLPPICCSTSFPGFYSFVFHFFCLRSFAFLSLILPSRSRHCIIIICCPESKNQAD